MLEKYFKKPPARILLGHFAVVPRDDFKRWSEEWALIESTELEPGIYQSLREIFTFPKLSDISDKQSNDLVIDIMVPDYQGGDFWSGSFGEIAFLYLWRPRVKIAARLYNRISGKTVMTSTVTEKMAWSYYLGRLWSWRGFTRLKPLFDSEDMDYLLSQASHKLLLKIQKSMQ